QAQGRVGGLKLFEYIVWGHTLPPSTEVGSIRSGFKICIDGETLQKSAALLPRTARRQPILSTTILPASFSRRSTEPISIVPMNFFLRATHERTASNGSVRT